MRRPEIASLLLRFAASPSITLPAPVADGVLEPNPSCATTTDGLPADEPGFAGPITSGTPGRRSRELIGSPKFAVAAINLGVFGERTRRADAELALGTTVVALLGATVIDETGARSATPSSGSKTRRSP